MVKTPCNLQLCVDLIYVILYDSIKKLKNVSFLKKKSDFSLFQATE